VHPSICSSICPSICPSVHLSINLSITHPVCTRHCFSRWGHSKSSLGSYFYLWHLSVDLDSPQDLDQVQGPTPNPIMLDVSAGCNMRSALLCSESLPCCLRPHTLLFPYFPFLPGPCMAAGPQTSQWISTFSANFPPYALSLLPIG
jgi:hypothetical protein